jgi:hypothetical protein
MAAGEGIETMLSLRRVISSMAMVAALSAAHLGAILFPAMLRRLYIVRDDDRAGDGAMKGLIDRTRMATIEAMVLSPQCGDFNKDLRNFDINALRATLRIQLAPKTWYGSRLFSVAPPGQSMHGGDSHPPLSNYVTNRAIARLDRIRWANGENGAGPIRLAMQRTMQRHCAIFRTGSLLEEGADKLDEVIAMMQDLGDADRSMMFNTDLAEADRPIFPDPINSARTQEE